MNTYKIKFFSRCPTNGIRIEYDLTIAHQEVVTVEKIIDATELMTRNYHEEIADQLHREFGGVQTLIANHHGVTIETLRK